MREIGDMVQRRAWVREIKQVNEVKERHRVGCRVYGDS